MSTIATAAIGRTLLFGAFLYTLPNLFASTLPRDFERRKLSARKLRSCTAPASPLRPGGLRIASIIHRDGGFAAATLGLQQFKWHPDQSFRYRLAQVAFLRCAIGV